MNIKIKKSYDSLVPQFKARENDIRDLVLDQKNDYHGSDCRKKLERRMQRLDDSVDMKFSPMRNRSRQINDFKSRISMPLVREKFKAFTGMVLAAFRNDPIVTVLPDGMTPAVNAFAAQEVVMQNYRRTMFKLNTWREAVVMLGRYGTAVMPMQYKQTGYSQSYEKTQYGPFGFEVGQPQNAPKKHNVWNYCCHPLNYFQNKNIPNPHESDYQGYIKRESLARLIDEYHNDPHVIKDNLYKVIQQAMNEATRDEKYFAKGRVTDWYRVGVDVTYRWGKLYIKGQEGDERCYYMEFVGDKIIKFMTNPNDEDLVPISIYTADKRLEYWWGNTPIENSMSMENFLNMILGIQADQALQMVERTLFYDGNAGIDVGDLNNRKKNGGYVRFNGKLGMRAQDIFYEYQSRGYPISFVDPIIREIKEADQRVSFDNDFARRAAEGGPQNETAYAANLMDQKGNILKSELLEAVSGGLIQTTRGNLLILQRMLPDYFLLSPDKTGVAPLTVFKEHILGTFEYRLQTSITKNEITQRQNLLNFLTQMANLRNVSPEIQQVAMNLRPIIVDLTRKHDLDVDLNEIFPPQMPAAPQQALPMAGGGMNVGAMAGAGAQPGQAPATQPQAMEMANAAAA